jgi:hypothetical protein
VLADATCGLDAVQNRHRDVHQRHVWIERERLLERLLPVAGAADDVDPFRRQHRVDHLDEKGIVVRDEYADVIGRGVDCGLHKLRVNVSAAFA